MTASNANIFTGPTGTLPVVNAQGQLYEEVQVATAGQTVFTLATFNYTPNTKSVYVLKNGVELRRAVGYTETDSSHITLAAGAAINDVITIKAFAVSQTLAPLQNNGVLPAGTTNQVLAKSSGSDYALKWLDLSAIATLLDQPVQNVASAPTVDVTPYAGATRNLLITGATQIDGWAITAGQVFLVKFAASLSLSNNVNQVTPTGAAIKVGPNDSCLVRATATNVVEILSFSKSTSVIPPQYNDHRLSLVSGSPVNAGDTIGAGTVYLTAYKGNNISLFNGSAWIVRQFTEISLALVGLVAAKPYDVFCYDNAGTPALEILVWTNDTTRATALARQDGVWVKSSDVTRKYMGSLYTTGIATTEDSKANRYLWNMYNRVQRKLVVLGNAATWAYGGAAIRQANGSSANQLNFVTGLAEDSIPAQINTAGLITAGTSPINAGVGIGVDSTTTANGPSVGVSNAQNSLFTFQVVVDPVLGKHSLMWNEYAGAATTVTFSGGNAGYISAVLPN